MADHHAFEYLYPKLDILLAVIMLTKEEHNNKLLRSLRLTLLHSTYLFIRMKFL